MTETIEAQIARIDERTDIILKTTEKINEHLIVLNGRVVNLDKRTTRLETIVKVVAWVISGGGLIAFIALMVRLAGK